jgi:hypothetical protein
MQQIVGNVVANIVIVTPYVFLSILFLIAD